MLTNHYNCIYKLTSPSGKIYIGQTSDFNRRMEEHVRKTDCKMLHGAIKKYGLDAFTKEILVEDIADQKELDRLETEFIKKYDSMNKDKGYNIAAGGCSVKRADGHHIMYGTGKYGEIYGTPEYRRKEYEANKEKIIKRIKKYHDTHLDEHKERCKRYQDQNKEKISAKKKEHYQSHLDQYKTRLKEYYDSHPEEFAERRKAYNETHKEENKERCKRYYERNKERIREQQKENREKHREDDRERSRLFRQQHPNYQKKYYEDHKEELKEKRRINLAKKKASETPNR